MQFPCAATPPIGLLTGSWATCSLQLLHHPSHAHRKTSQWWLIQACGSAMLYWFRYWFIHDTDSCKSDEVQRWDIATSDTHERAETGAQQQLQEKNNMWKSRHFYLFWRRRSWDMKGNIWRGPCSFPAFATRLIPVRPCHWVNRAEPSFNCVGLRYR